MVLSFALPLAQLWMLQAVDEHTFRDLADVNRFQQGGGPSNAALVAMEILKSYFHYTEPSPSLAPRGLKPAR